MSTPALEAAAAAGLSYRVIRHGPVGSLAEAARARGVAPADVVKTLVVRRGDDDSLFVLVPGDRALSWPKLRRLLGGIGCWAGCRPARDTELCPLPRWRPPGPQVFPTG